MVHKSEHTVHMHTGAVVGITVHTADQGETTSIQKTLDHTSKNICDIAKKMLATQQTQAVTKRRRSYRLSLQRQFANPAQNHGLMTRISELDRRQRKWKAIQAERKVVYENRQRIKYDHGIVHRVSHGEGVERTFAHCYETNTMRRATFRGHSSMPGQQGIYVRSFNEEALFCTTARAVTARRRHRNRRNVHLWALTACPHHTIATILNRLRPVQLLDTIQTSGSRTGLANLLAHNLRPNLTDNHVFTANDLSYTRENAP